MVTGLTDAAAAAGRVGAATGSTERRTERLSLLPLSGAVGAIAVGGRVAWPVAASLLAVAYLALYLGTRR